MTAANVVRKSRVRCADAVVGATTASLAAASPRRLRKRTLYQQGGASGGDEMTRRVLAAVEVHFIFSQVP